MYECLQPETIPHAVLIIADYQYKSAFVADQEINLVIENWGKKTQNQMVELFGLMVL